jgi:hypothetical protein
VTNVQVITGTRKALLFTEMCSDGLNQGGRDELHMQHVMRKSVTKILDNFE